MKSTINGKNLLYRTNGLYQVWKNILNTHPREKTVSLLRKYGDKFVDSYDYVHSYVIIPGWVRAGEGNSTLFRAGGLEVPIIVSNQFYKKYTLSVAKSYKALFFLCISALIIFSPVPPSFAPRRETNAKDAAEAQSRMNTTVNSVD